MKTIKFFASLGVVAGYGHDNSSEEPALVIAGRVWQEVSAAIMAETGVYVSAVLTPAKTVYHTDWGCPVGGENTVLITGDCNPQFTEVAAYKAAVVETLRRAATALRQSTTQLSFLEVELEYLDFRTKSE